MWQICIKFRHYFFSAVGNTDQHPWISTHRNLLPISGDEASFVSMEGIWGGLRKQGLVKHDHESLPLVSVITVVRNAAATLRETLESVFIQAYDNIELIVVDGASDDGTLDIIRENEGKIDLWVSGPDRGIYDAMNKGLGYAGGRYVHFLNADDHYCFHRSLQLVVEAFQKHRCRLIHTNVLMLNERRGYGWIRHSNVSGYYYLFKGIPQQAFFYDRSLFAEFGKFDLEYPVVADLEFLLRIIIKHKIPGRYVNCPAVVFLSGGVSGDMESKRMEREKVLRKYYPGWAFVILRNKLVEKFLTRNEWKGRRKNFVEKLLR